MTTCDTLSDRMPSVAAGRGGWTAGEAAHLEACAACRAEWALVQEAQALGRDARPGRTPDALAAAVLARVAAARGVERRRRAVRWAATWGGLAAAAAVMLAVLFRRTDGRPASQVAVGAAPAPAPAIDTPRAAEVVPGTPPPDRPPLRASAALGLPLPELDDADATELQAVLDALDRPLGDASDAASGDEVTPLDMERAMRSLEG